MQEVNMEEGTLDDISFITYIVESDNESVQEADQNDMMSLVSMSGQENYIYDFSENIIPSDDTHDEIKEENTQNANLEHGDTDGKNEGNQTNDRKRKCGSRVTKIKKN